MHEAAGWPRFASWCGPRLKAVWQGGSRCQNPLASALDIEAFRGRDTDSNCVGMLVAMGLARRYHGGGSIMSNAMAAPAQMCARFMSIRVYSLSTFGTLEDLLLLPLLPELACPVSAVRLVTVHALPAPALLVVLSQRRSRCETHSRAAIASR